MRSASLRHGRNRILFAAFLLGWVLLCTGREHASAEDLIQRVGEALKQQLSQKEDGAPSFCRRKALCGRAVLEGFYRERAFRPAWMEPDGRSVHAQGLVASIRKSSLEGLTPDVYHLAVIEALLESVDNALAAGTTPEPAVLADLEILLTDAFLIYGSHLLSGRVDPETLHTAWTVKTRQADLADILQAALEKGEVGEALQGLLPRYPAYERLREGLREYRAIRDRGGWQSVASGPTLREGDRDPRVPSLRDRMIASGDMEKSEPADPELFDDTLGRAVRRFQALHGLANDGAVGPETLAALNQPVEHRIRQIELNMERWRWLPEDLGRVYILVNTAGFFLQVVEEGREALAMRVVVGRKYRRTPVFTGTMTYLVLNPTWEIPHSIAVRDILPKIKKDPGYLDRQGIRVFGSWSDSASAIPPGTIDWTAVTGHNFAYRLRQDPGPANALGRVKFMLPNRFAVYLHDTPQRNLFERSRRDFSSGCIRVEAPVELAAYVLRGKPKWNREAILSAIQSGKTRTVLLPEPIPVHLLYWTAWVDAEGDIRFRDDVYGRDGPLDEALKEGPLGYQ